MSVAPTNLLLMCDRDGSVALISFTQFIQRLSSPGQMSCTGNPESAAIACFRRFHLICHISSLS